MFYRDGDTKLVEPIKLVLLGMLMRYRRGLARNCDGLEEAWGKQLVEASRIDIR